MLRNDTPLISFGFNGLVNNADPLSLTINDLKACSNYMLDNEKLLHVREGFSELFDAEAFYVTKDKTRAFVIQNSNLYELDFKSDTLVLLKESIGSAPYIFEDVNAELLFLMCSDATWSIVNSRVIPWGIELPGDFSVIELAGGGNLVGGEYRVSIAYDVDGVPSGSGPIKGINVTNGSSIRLDNLPVIAGKRVIILCSRVGGGPLFRYTVTSQTTFTIIEILNTERSFRFTNTSPPPFGTHVAYDSAQLFVGISTSTVSQIFPSIPNQYHFFHLDEQNGIIVNEEILLLASSATGLIVGTRSQVLSFQDGVVDTLLNYGVVRGTNFDYNDDGDLLITTVKGVRLLTNNEIVNVNEDKYLADWGELCGSGFVRYRGTPQYIVSKLKEGVNYFKPYVPIEPELIDHTF